jgi:hypothetical protein
MLSKRPISAGARAKTADVFGGARWQHFAKAFANRYRRIRRRSGLFLRWRRHSVALRWARQHWLPSSGVMNWRLNLNLNADMKEFVREHRHYLRITPEHEPTIFGGDGAPTARPTARLISQHFLMQRMIRMHMLSEQQSVMSLVKHTVHTAVRSVVRENLRVEHTLVTKTVAERNGETEVSVEVRKPAAVVQMPNASTITPRMPEINISQIADQVMRQLDHRISSWRERRGRS